MPTANTTSARGAKTGVKTAGKRAAVKTSAARRAGSSARRRASSSARSKTTRAKATRSKTTRSKATGSKSARTRTANQTQSAIRQAEAATRWPLSDRPSGVVGDYAERAVLIPVGAALIARDRVVSSVNDTISSYSSTSKAQAQLRRFERRGTTARNRIEREVRKARVRFERELRGRRREIEKTVSDLEDRRDAVTKNGTELANRVPDLANRVQERILSLV